jgi:hypothetical protein
MLKLNKHIMKLNFNHKSFIKAAHIRLVKFSQGIWLFPAVLTLVLIVLCAFQINGSSMGVYHEIFYGDSQPDPALIAGKPQPIRSDEWTVNTQKVIAQSNNGYAPINKNIGNGEDETLIIDPPTNDWSGVFKPHNLGFFVLPFNNAFSLRWWAMSYFLVISCYFFVLIILPKKRLLASILSLGFLFSPFIQWWYQYITLGPIYYSLFGMVIFTKLLGARNKKRAVLWSLLLTYIMVCFVLVLYPPFQIPCAIVAFAFILGYYLDKKKIIAKNDIRRNLILFVCAIIISLSIVGIFVYQKRDIVNTIQNTAYPGQRVVKSGGYSLEHLMSSNLSPLFQSSSRAAAYSRPSIEANQSGSSNFILITPFLICPALYIYYKRRKNDKKPNYILASLSILSAVFLAWIFIPGIDLMGKLTLLSLVPHTRLLIGLGLLNLIFIITFIKLYSDYKGRFSIIISSLYAFVILAFYLFLDFLVMSEMPGFMNYKYAIVLALPMAMIAFCFMRKMFIVAASGLLLLALLSTFRINPIYQGTSVLVNTPLSQEIRSIGKNSNDKWISEDIAIENFATMNGERSLTGVYVYPQLELWNSIANSEQKNVYNRYAHVNFNFTRNVEKSKPSLFLVNTDQFAVKLQPCDKFLQENNVGFLITSKIFNEGEARCANLIDSVVYPNVTYFIYKLDL